MAQSLSHPEERTPHPRDTGDVLHHVPGSMDISRHEATFHAFIRFTVRMVVAIVVVLIFLALVNA